MVIQLLFWREKARKLKAPSKQSHGFSPAGAVCLFAQQIQTASCCTWTCASSYGDQNDSGKDFFKPYHVQTLSHLVQEFSKAQSSSKVKKTCNLPK